jgi:predicted HTH transcriptional regulator
MSILGREIDEGRLLELCAQHFPESQTLDLKQQLPGNADADKREFLKDVCAMANSDGGDLVYGVAEAGGNAGALSPIAGETADSARRRLGQIADAGLEPRVVGLKFVDVPVTGGYVLIARVPASFDGPHRFFFGNVARFVIRNGTHTVDLNYDQLRMAFDRTATLTERARQFRQARIDAITGDRVGRALVRGPRAVVHLVPIPSMAGNRSVDIESL